MIPEGALRIVMVCSKLPEDIWLINTLADVCHIEGIVFPTGTRYREYGMAHVPEEKNPAPRRDRGG